MHSGRRGARARVAVGVAACALIVGALGLASAEPGGAMDLPEGEASSSSTTTASTTPPVSPTTTASTTTTTTTVSSTTTASTTTTTSVPTSTATSTTAVASATSAAPEAVTSDEPGIFYSNSQSGWVESISGPVYPVLLGGATATPANYSPGDTVTVTVTVLYPIDHCDGTYGDGSPRSRDAGAQQVAINWNGSELVSADPIGLVGDRFYTYQGGSGASWVIPISRGTADEFLQEGETFTASFVAPDSDALPTVDLQAQKLQADACTSILDSGDITLRGGGVPVGVGGDPSPSFSYSASPDDPLEITFFNQSTDPVDDPEDLTYEWDFDDGDTSTERNPVHTYARAGTYAVTLRVTNTNGESKETTRQVVVEGAIVVNSTGDAPAEDPGAGCDTGAEIDGKPECTLRAAIETVNDGGGEAATSAAGDGPTIGFDIAGAGVPTIALTGSLPGVSASDVTIDGTSQAAGKVAIDGGSIDAAGLTLTGDDITVSAMVLDDAKTGLRIGGDRAVVEDSVIGADPEATTAGSIVGSAVSTHGAGATIRNSVLIGQVGVFDLGSETTVSGCKIGVSGSGAAALGDTTIGFLGLGAGATVEQSTIRGDKVAIDVVEADATITGNRIGVASEAAVALDDQGMGIRLDGATGATVEDNAVVAGSFEVPGGATQAPAAHIEVIGGLQLSLSEDGTIRWFQYGVSPRTTPVTGGHARVANNVVGAEALGASPGTLPPTRGVLVWDDAPDVEIDGNTIAGPDRAGIEVPGGSGHRIVSNQVGTTSGGAEVPPAFGVLLSGVPDAVVGEEGAGNTITATTGGVVGIAATGSVSVGANEVTQGQVDDPADTGGIIVRFDDPSTVSGNTVVGFERGVDTKSPAEVVANVVTGSQIGIVVDGDSSVSDNIVYDTVDAAVVSKGEDNTLEDNVIGRTAPGGPVEGNDGDGIQVREFHAEVRDNDIAGSGGNGIALLDGGTALLRANEIADSDGLPIFGVDDPLPPTVVALDSSVGTSKRTTLLVSDLPTDDTGTIEVFANEDCTDGEAEVALKVTRTKAPADTLRIIQLIGRSSDHFTVTYTSGDDETSELSNCAAISAYPDGDGDGSIDPIDALGGSESNPRQAAVITDDERLVLVGLGPETGGRLTRVGVVDDPAPTDHPDDFRLVYGALGFQIEGLDIGDAAEVQVVAVTGEDGAPGDSYWKYGPPTIGASPEWYDFSPDEATGTGAEASVIDLGRFGFRRSWILHLVDGQRGDASGPDGTIVDPGGPGLRGEPTPEPEPEPVPVTEPPTETTPTTAPASTGSPAEVGTGTLPRTGSDVAGGAQLAVVLLGAGVALLLLSRGRTRPVAPSSVGSAVSPLLGSPPDQRRRGPRRTPRPDSS